MKKNMTKYEFEMILNSMKFNEIQWASEITHNKHGT